jgi:hypothetical protein
MKILRKSLHPWKYREPKTSRTTQEKKRRRDLDLNQALSLLPFSNMIKDVVNLGLLKVGQQFGVSIVSHG